MHSATPNQEQHSALELLSMIITVIKTTREKKDTENWNPFVLSGKLRQYTSYSFGVQVEQRK